MAEITPMMKQYLEIKEQNKDSILFFRLGDFYEMFNEDAQLASRELDLTLTTRDRGKAAEDQTPMCGIPYHSSDAYIARLIAKGYKVPSASRPRTLRSPRALSSAISSASSRPARSSTAHASTTGAATSSAASFWTGRTPARRSAT